MKATEIIRKQAEAVANKVSEIKNKYNNLEDTMNLLHKWNTNDFNLALNYEAQSQI